MIGCNYVDSSYEYGKPRLCLTKAARGQITRYASNLPVSLALHVHPNTSLNLT